MEANVIKQRLKPKFRPQSQSGLEASTCLFISEYTCNFQLKRDKWQHVEVHGSLHPSHKSACVSLKSKRSGTSAVMSLAVRSGSLLSVPYGRGYFAECGLRKVVKG